MRCRGSMARPFGVRRGWERVRERGNVDLESQTSCEEENSERKEVRRVTALTTR